MEYKICENCEAKLHARTLRCPNCNTLLTEASKIVSDTPEQPNVEENIEKNLGNNIDIEISDNEAKVNTISPENVNNTVKDYVYKAEVHHSLEYTKPLSNLFKVILTAFCMTPIFGQFIGVFFGIFFTTYDDNDRSSFGKSLIFLSVIMFMIYGYNIMMVSELFANGELANYLNNLVK